MNTIQWSESRQKKSNKSLSRKRKANRKSEWKNKCNKNRKLKMHTAQRWMIFHLWFSVCLFVFSLVHVLVLYRKSIIKLCIVHVIMPSQNIIYLCIWCGWWLVYTHLPFAAHYIMMMNCQSLRTSHSSNCYYWNGWEFHSNVCKCRTLTSVYVAPLDYLLQSQTKLLIFVYITHTSTQVHKHIENN